MTNNFYKHLSVVMRHKHEVYKAMKLCGHPIQGVFHDMSKFSPVEFFESVKYFQGNRSPIEAAKEDHGYSLAWLHHRGRNPHHSQYWCDISFGEIKPCEIPWKYLLELICDGIAAGKVYNGGKWNDSVPLEYWQNRDSKSFYHEKTRAKLERYYNDIADLGWENVAKIIRSCGDYANIENYPLRGQRAMMNLFENKID